MFLIILVGVSAAGPIGGTLEVGTVDNAGLSSVRLDFSGVAMFYSWGAGLFLIGG